MTKAKCSEQDKAFISALVDNEASVDTLDVADVDTDTLARYSLIGNVMRSETAPSIQLDIAAQVAQQLEQEPVHAQFDQQSISRDEVPQQDNVIRGTWWRGITQTAIAASVAVVAVLGVQQYGATGNGADELPPLQSNPFIGAASPVSYSSEPALESAERGLRELQQQRIGALVLEHQRQTREAAHLANTVNNKDEQDQQEQ
ncbi:RseA family anti-sigma factor [Pseudoalteromonas sp. BDTF-M6]|uniref:sigma-E factor negative regulatory protein n=1 Tax=Pseudoalteromonas sp. BDTF-M6 TaxID=2796132 RepID=UPI001BAF99DB|nr:RseA family anti-sigma factor [Pseudoalteromonas sp. BDTF-M6]MBS3799063.1 metal ABC transporter ATP-binding protein [Pseudoalteromonas sp. BDTF-M6]